VWSNRGKQDFKPLKCLPIEYICRTALVNKDFRHHEVCNDDRDNHGVILVNGVDAFEILDGMEITLLGLAR